MDEDNQKQLTVLKRKRGVIKGSLTRLRNFVKEFDPVNKPASLLEFRQEELPRINAKFDEVQCEIDLISDNLEEENNERDRFEKDYFELRSDMQEIISSYKASSTIGHNVSFNASSTSRRFNLVPISLPKFNGNIENWESFYDVFQAMVHNEETLSVTQKLYYLRTCLTGPALDMVSSIPMTDSNYEILLQRLKQRYDNRNLVIQAHIRALLDSPRMDAGSLDSLQKLHSHVESHLAALKALGQPIEHWNAWLVTLVFRCLDKQTMQDWQLRQTDTELPKYEAVERFLAGRCAALESCSFQDAYKGKTNSSNSSSSELRKSGAYVNPKKVTLVAEQNKLERCAYCTGAHRLYSCESFRNLSTSKRLSMIRGAKLCYNCFSPYHVRNNCKSKYSCHVCKEKHNTLLHFEGTNIPRVDHAEEHSATESESLAEEVKNSNSVSLSVRAVNGHVFLATAMVLVINNHGMSHECRVILDSGSQVNFASKRLVNLLKLPIKKTLLPVGGIGGSKLNSTSSVELKVKSRVKDFDFELTGYVLPTIVSELIAAPIPVGGWRVPEELAGCLADPSFSDSGPIDLLIGAGMFFDLMEAERVPFGTGTMSLQDSKLGWVITGSISLTCLVSAGEKLEGDWRALTSGEDADYGRQSTANKKCIEEQDTAQHFQETAKRDGQGRFVLRLPFKVEVNNIGETLKMATSRFLSVERRLQRDESLKNAYTMFMEEYERTGHMVEITEDNSPKKLFYLPHHPVFKASSSTTKLRVVFDASAKSSTGVALNDVLMRGPTVQEELFAILLRFRKHQYVLTADIEKMFRQIAVAKEDQDFQRIVWRASPSENLRSYRLTTVTYGTTSASYMATQCLSVLAEEHVLIYPEASKAIGHDFYMDDLMTGARTIEECMVLQQQITSIFDSAAMPIRKWCSNSDIILANLEVKDSEPLYIIRTETNDVIKSLGLCWNPKRDQLGFQVVPIPTRTQVTKRILLSDLNKIFDPLGFLSPVLIKGKIFLQQLWQLQIGWDKPLTKELKNKWELFYQHLRELGSIPIPRKCIPSYSNDIELHGFCDASLEAYGACIYVRSKDNNDQWHSHLICSKTRVTPLKGTTIPRLELCGALVLTQLTKKVAEAWGLKTIDFHLWTDSTVVLGWLNSQTSRLKTYVGNRVEQILEITNVDQWKHVVTGDNPADLLSRGISPTELKHSTLWWNGPRWLTEDKYSNVSDRILVSEELLPEIREMKFALTAVEPLRCFINAHRSWQGLLRAVAWLLRFIQYIKKRMNTDEPKYLRVPELKKATLAVLKLVQAEAFNEEVALLKAEKPLLRKSNIKNLCPFLKDGLIHVGGRLENANISYQQKHPIVIPANHVVTRMIFEHYHRELSHCGPQSLLAQVRRQYWPLRGRVMARIVTTHCITCIRAKPNFLQPMMAPLPKDRVQPSRPFAVTGVDFAGPLIIRSGVRRVSGTKAWIAVFVCFSTRAIHLEVVENLTSNAFVACLRRFMSRRGKCTRIYSDNGTNFVGAQKELTTFVNKIDAQMAREGIEWFFNPPSAPHFGGLWESAVKSTKSHLNKIMKDTNLTIGELNTLLCQIEACVNSRPMTPISNDPSDLEVLTPAHFLIGGPIFFPPEVNLTNESPNGLRRWKYVQYLMHMFWKRWENEYLPQCQIRGKWLSKSRPLKINDVVIIKGEGTHPTKWKLGRVIQLHPGRDGITRVVTLRTAGGTEICRPAVKLCRLPNQEDEEGLENTDFQGGENVEA